ncbi:MAG: hypothetical protein FJ279_03830 [Planctomycetes bacterium]|nr:hypothetical protein [Planctomycetota bacterium]MBM4078898.1 hypothetical protein [Planctomycetota bacterium]MBM4086199.1 hypothetical protein [Planctomycetota bacterium]
MPNPKKIKGGCKVNTAEGGKKIVASQCPAVQAVRQARKALLHAQREPKPNAEQVQKLRADLHAKKIQGLEQFCPTCKHAQPEAKEA